jgi:lipopolysaccharide transport system ATP-binding protein
VSDTVIRVENLSKKYTIRHQQSQQYTSLRDVITEGVQSIGRRLTGAKQDSSMSSTQEEFWALKDVSFEVKQGDRIGIIGRNGAGKSTLLKILSRIVEPTTGEITLNGRVASLLEVGTGFHPELTGRENILGMSRLEIQNKFDEIVDFSEVEKFLDTPVKRYSSGMYVRLAFAVAAHLDPEILIVDEVLAVGDAAFQKKCLEKIGDISEKEGKTILFVSHNIAAIRNLCTRAIFLKLGQLFLDSGVEIVVNKYFSEFGLHDSLVQWNLQDSPGSEEIYFSKAYILNDKE